MTTQAVSATIGNGRMSKVFSGTITDGVWTNIQDSISSTNLGILIPNAIVNFVQAEYTAGLAAYRVQNAQTLQVSRRGWAAKDDYSCYETSKIAPYSISPDDMIQVYALPVDATANQTAALAWFHTTKGTELYKATDIADNTGTALKTALQDQTLGDAAFNSTLTGFSICLEDGAQLDKVEFIDSSGGVQMTFQGNYRMPTQGGTSAYYNMKVDGLSLPITKGYTVKVYTVSA